MAYAVSNPTSGKKAVRVIGSRAVIKPGGSDEFDMDWTDAEVAQYRGAGLVVEEIDAPEPEEPSENAVVTEEVINAMEKDELVPLLNAQGHEFDGRLGVEKLREMAIELIIQKGAD